MNELKRPLTPTQLPRKAILQIQLTRHIETITAKVQEARLHMWQAAELVIIILVVLIFHA